ncbi:MAG: hypothetical protein ACR2LZ_03055 [Pyrinomonadaceae bacterium]
MPRLNTLKNLIRKALNVPTKPLASAPNCFSPSSTTKRSDGKS